MTTTKPSKEHPALATTLAPQSISDITSDTNMLLNHALKNSIAIPNDYIPNPPDEKTQIANYNSLIKTIEPATLRSIQYLDRSIFDGLHVKKWYQVPVFTKCLIIAIFALLLLMGVSLSPIVDEEHQAKGLLNSSGIPLLLNLLFICSASLLGVMFYLLKTISGKIKNYTLLPTDSLELNSTIIIGLISGFIIAELFSFTTSSALTENIEINKMTLALLGGFSSDAIFSILQGIVNKVKMLIATN